MFVCVSMCVGCRFVCVCVSMCVHIHVCRAMYVFACACLCGRACLCWHQGQESQRAVGRNNPRGTKERPWNVNGRSKSLPLMNHSVCLLVCLLFHSEHWVHFIFHQAISDNVSYREYMSQKAVFVLGSEGLNKIINWFWRWAVEWVFNQF